MASIAEILIGQAGQAGTLKSEADVAGNLMKGYQVGSEIALKKEQLEQAKAEHAAKVKEASTAKLDKFVTAMEKGSSLKGQARNNYYGKVLPSYRDALDLTDTFPNESLAFVTSSPETMARGNTIIARVRKGELTEEQGIAMWNDPVAVMGTPPTFDEAEAFISDVQEAGKNRLNFQAQENALRSANSKFQQSEGRQADQYESTQSLAKREKLQGEITKLGLPVLGAKLDRLNSIIPGGLNKYKNQDIPGFGGYRAKLPIGQVSAEERKNRQELLQLGNSVIKKVTGAGGGEVEMNRILRSIGMEVAIGEGGGFTSLVTGASSSADIVRGIQAIQKEYQADSEVLKRTYGEDLYNEIAGGRKKTSAPAPTAGRTAAIVKDTSQMATAAQALFDKYAGNPAAQEKIRAQAEANGVKLRGK